MLPVRKLFPAAAKYPNKSGGFLLAEILACSLLLLITAGSLCMGGNAYLRYYHKSQVRQAAHMLAADIRLLQQQSMFGDGIFSRQLKFMADKSGYGFYINRRLSRKVFFEMAGCGGVYLDNGMAYVQYSDGGSPSLTGRIVLRHRNLAAYSCVLEIQPVTGRVLFNEGE